MYKILVFFLLWTTSVLADEATIASPEQLRQLELRIQKLQAQMQNNRTQYGQLQRHLQDSEEYIGEVAQRLETLHGALTDKQHTLADLKHKQLTFSSQLNTQHQVLAQQIRAAYITGQQNYLKLWLNQEDPFTLGRVITYYNYFNNSQIKQIAKIKKTLQDLTILKQAIESEQTDLNELVKNQTSKKRELELNYDERQKILVRLTNTLESQDEELKRLQEDKHHLNLLLGNLQNTFANTLPPIGQYKTFASLKGQLPHPVSGKVIHHFGERLVGQLKWQGMLIASSKGKKVRAIAAGRVVFAQWFRHVGLLVIIDHGAGYMSLYAHNQSLYTKTGNWLNANDIIASVGNSGGQRIAALYFEIRHQGVPQPPQKWLR